MARRLALVALAILALALLPVAVTGQDSAAPVNIVADGDSLTAGSYLSLPESYPGQIFTMRPGWTLVNLGIPGAWCSGLRDLGDRVDPYLEDGATNIVVMWCGTNDIGWGHRSVNSTYHALRSYALARRSAGWHVVVVGMIPRHQSGVINEEDRALFNDLLRRTSGAWSDAFVDLADDGRIGAASSWSDPLYFMADAVHLTAVGQAAVATHVERAVSRLIPQYDTVPTDESAPLPTSTPPTAATLTPMPTTTGTATVTPTSTPEGEMSNWWEAGGATGAVRAYAPVGAANLAVSYADLTGNQDAFLGVAPSFDAATGWTFNGSTQYLDTGYSPPNQTAISLLLRFSDGALSGGNLPLVTSNGFQNLGLTPYSDLFGAAWFVNNGGSSNPAGVTSGVIGMTEDQGYLNGVAYGSSFTPTAASGHRTFLIGAYHGGSPSLFFSGKIQAVAIYNVNLSGAQMLAISNAMAALPTAAASDSPLPPLFAPNLAMRAY